MLLHQLEFPVGRETSQALIKSENRLRTAYLRSFTLMFF